MTEAQLVGYENKSYTLGYEDGWKAAIAAVQKLIGGTDGQG